MISPRLANRLWNLTASLECRRFARALHDPRQSQIAILQRYLRTNADTSFGKRHDFAAISTPEDYARRVPVASYDAFQPDIDRIAAGEPRVFTAEPVRYFALSSGSAAAEKKIPYTASLQKEFSRAIAPWIANLFRTHPDLRNGPAYWSITPVASAQPTSTTKIPVGFEEDSAYLGGFAKRLVDAALAVPSDIRHIADIPAFRYATLLWLLRARELRLISVWHPSFLQLLLHAAESHWPDLLSDIRLGTCRIRDHLPASIQHPTRPNPRRAAELAAAGPRAFAQWWPNLRLLSCWADAHARIPAQQLAAIFPAAHLQPKGLISTEAFSSFPIIHNQIETHPLAITSHYFELLPDNAPAIPAWQADTGGIYTLVVTTAGGFYRYLTHDRVRITGRLHETPTLEFLGKTDHVSDRFGEKLNAEFVARQIQTLLTESHLAPHFAMLAPHLNTYILFIDSPAPESLSPRLDDLLCENPHYAYCRRLGQLEPAQVVHVDPAAATLYLETCARRGQRLGNIKPAALHTWDGWRSVLEPAEARC